MYQNAIKIVSFVNIDKKMSAAEMEGTKKYVRQVSDIRQNREKLRSAGQTLALPVEMLLVCSWYALVCFLLVLSLVVTDRPNAEIIF